MRFALYLPLCLVLLLFSACKDGPINGDKPPCPPIRIAAPSPYGEPVWHQSGEFIGFTYTPLVRITYPYGEHCQGKYEWNWDSAGYWLINADGTNMRRIFPYGLEMVSWSPNGEWIAFGVGAQIYKMRFTGTTFDTTTLTQLTFEGRNFFPAWSPDGQWIAYNKSICEGPKTCGIWLMTSTGTNHRFLAGPGNYPHWQPSGTKILYLTRAITQRGQIIGDSLWLFDPDANTRSFLTFLGAQNNDNRYARYSPDGSKIAFGSRPLDGRFDIWVMNADGSQPRQLTTQGTGDGWLSWSPDGNHIVYLSHRFDDWSYANGTLWIINVQTGQKREITFNRPPGG